MKESRLGLLLIVPTALSVILVVIYPLLYNLYLSLVDMRLTEASAGFVGLANYVSLLSDSTYWNSWVRSFVWTIGSLVLQLAFGVSLGILLNQKVVGRSLLRSLLIIPWILPPVVTTILWKVILLSPRWGILNYVLFLFGIPPVLWLAEESTAMATIIAVNVWYGFPLIMIVTLAGLQSIPSALYDAAKVDGASNVSIFRHVTLPSISAFLLTIILLRFIWIFQFFDIPWLMTQGGPLDATTILPLLTYRTAFAYLKISQGATIALTMAGFLFIWIVAYMRILRRQ